MEHAAQATHVGVVTDLAVAVYMTFTVEVRDQPRPAAVAELLVRFYT